MQSKKNIEKTVVKGDFESKVNIFKLETEFVDKEIMEMQEVENVSLKKTTVLIQCSIEVKLEIFSPVKNNIEELANVISKQEVDGMKHARNAIVL